MTEYAVDVLPGEVLAWAREDAARKAPRLRVRASMEYQADAAFARDAEAADEDDIEAVTVSGVLEVSPRRGRHAWTLEVRGEDSVGLRASGEDEGYEDQPDLPLEAFEARFLVPEHGEVEVVVRADDTAAWQSFQRWLGRRRQSSGGKRTSAGPSGS